MHMLSSDTITRLEQAEKRIREALDGLKTISEADQQATIASCRARQYATHLAHQSVDVLGLTKTVDAQQDIIARMARDQQAIVTEARRQAARADAAERMIEEIRAHYWRDTPNDKQTEPTVTEGQS